MATAALFPTLPHITVVEENDLYAVGWVRTMDEVKEVLATFMGKTNLNYRMYRVVKNFGNRGKLLFESRSSVSIERERDRFFFASTCTKFNDLTLRKNTKGTLE